MKVTMIRESMTESVIKDIISLTLLVVVIGIGKWCDSSAMQWAGFAMFTVMSIVASNLGNSRKSPQEAADWLRDEFNVVASPKK